MLCGYLSFGGDNNKILFKKIIECTTIIPKSLVNEANQILSQNLFSNSVKILSIKEIKVSEIYLKGKEIFNIISVIIIFSKYINGSKENDKTFQLKSI